MDILFTLLLFLLPPLSYGNYDNAFDKFLYGGYSIHFSTLPPRPNISKNAEYLNYVPSLFIGYMNSFHESDYSNIKFVIRDFSFQGGQIGVKFKF